MKIAIASDHGAFELKQKIAEYLNDKKDIKVFDLGTNNENISVDYPDYAGKVAKAIINKEVERGIIMCGTGIGISIAANKYKGIRAALCHNTYTAQMSREHNNANILAFGGRTTGIEIAKAMVDVWLTASYKGGRHQNRIDKIHKPEEN